MSEARALHLQNITQRLKFNYQRIIIVNLLFVRSRS